MTRNVVISPNICYGLKSQLIVNIVNVHMFIHRHIGEIISSYILWIYCYLFLITIAMCFIPWEHPYKQWIILTWGAAACCTQHGTLIDIPSKWDSCIFASDSIVDGRSFRCCLLQLISDFLYTNFCLVVFCVEHKKVNVINNCRKTRIIAPWESQTQKTQKI